MPKTANAGDSPKRRSYKDMTVSRLTPSGGYGISSMVDGYLHSQQFQGYSRKDAMKKYHDDKQKGQGK